MIKFDRDVHSAMRTLEKAGFETYATGECVRDAVRGVPAYDWDLLTGAELDDMKKLFPDGKVIDEEKQVMRVDYTCEVKDEDGIPYLEGVVVDIRHISASLEDELKAKAFTVNAMADNPEHAFIDPFDGRKDIHNKLIRTVSDADKLFKEQPIRMMEAVRLSAEMGYDLQKSIFDGILANWRLLLDGHIAEIREELEKLIVSPNAGKGLSLMAESGLMAVVFGEEVSKKMSSREIGTFEELCENIDKTKPVRTRRLGLLYTLLSKKKGIEAIERLKFDEKTKMHLIDAMNEIIDIQFLNDDLTFKRYLYEKGLERYDYLHNLSKAMRIVYDQPTTKIEARNYMMNSIKANKEAVFVEDLVIDSNDILEAGITDSAEQAEELLNMIIAVVHKNPKNNDRSVLLKMAKKYSKNKLAVKTRYITWIK